MTLGTHFIAGAAVAVVLKRHPVLALMAAFLAHLGLDAIPHWGYNLKSLERNREDPLESDLKFNKDFLRDLGLMAIDGFAGLAVTIYAIGFKDPSLLWLGILGGIMGDLPDFLQLIYHLFKNFGPIREFQRFHSWIQRDNALRENIFWGVISQIALVGAFLLIIVFFR